MISKQTLSLRYIKRSWWGRVHLSDFEEDEGWCGIRTVSFHIVITVLMQTGGDDCRSSEVCHAASYRLLKIRGLLGIINRKIKMLWCYIILSYHQKTLTCCSGFYINISLCLFGSDCKTSSSKHSRVQGILWVFKNFLSMFYINKTTDCFLFPDSHIFLI